MIGIHRKYGDLSINMFDLCNSAASRQILILYPPGSSVHGILQARVLEWVAISFSRGSSQPRDRTWAAAAAAKSLRSSQTLCNRTDGSPPGSPVPAISCTAGRYVQIYVNTHTYYNEKQRA